MTTTDPKIEALIKSIEEEFKYDWKAGDFSIYELNQYLRTNLPKLIKEVVLEALPPEEKPTTGGYPDAWTDGVNDCRQQIITSLSKRLGLE
jgi:hypothetical protein